SPRLDAIEEVTVSTAAQGAGDSGQGAAQVRFVTKSGSNDFKGSGYYYQRRDEYNANTWFNNRNGVAKTPLKQDQAGFAVGGPIVFPGLFDGHNKAFFFVNYEEFHQPGATTRNNRIVLNTNAQGGNFCYPGNCVNVLSLATANGQVGAVDPTIGKLLGDIRSAVTGGAPGGIGPNPPRVLFKGAAPARGRGPPVLPRYHITHNPRSAVSST